MITGCDTGFGHQSALHLNSNGMHVFACCLFPDRNEAKNLIINAVHPEKMHVIPMDVSREDSVMNAHEIVSKKLSSLDDVVLHSVVNNAGIGFCGEVEWGSMDMIRRVFDVNMFGQVLVSRTFMHFIRKNKGRIVNVNSVTSRITLPMAVPYCMSKHACLAFTEGLRREMNKFGVKVISIEPYFFGTQLTRTDYANNEFIKTFNASSEQVREAYGEGYLKKVLQLEWTYKYLAHQSLDPVVNAINHAITASHPRYHYVVANFTSKLSIYLVWYLFPQETIEMVIQMGLVLSDTFRLN